MKVTSLAVQRGLPIREALRGRSLNWSDLVVGVGVLVLVYVVVKLGESMTVNFTPGPSAGTHFDRHHQGPLLRRPLSAAYVHRSGCLLGLELASIFVIFTSQAWNMTFSFYHSLKSQPVELDEAARMYRLTKWQRFWKLDVPNACLTCPDFQTTVQFLPVHRRQAEETTALIEAAQSAGHERLAANHRRVLANLDKIISALDAIEGDGPDDD